MSMNNKGQGMSTNTIILLILGLVVLVALVWGFATGWSAFSQWFNPSNVDDVVQQCAASCSLGSTYGFCSESKILKANDDGVEISTSCLVLSDAPELSKYGIQNCAKINCDLECPSYSFEDIKADKKVQAEQNNGGQYVFQSGGKDCSFKLN